MRVIHACFSIFVLAMFFAGLVLVHRSNGVVVSCIDDRFLVGSGNLQIALRVAGELAAINHILGHVAPSFPCAIIMTPRFAEVNRYQSPMNFHQAKPTVDQIARFASETINPAFHHFWKET